MLTHVGLFEGSGIPSWCAQQAGFRTVAWCENNAWCQHWLREYIPDAKAIEDIKTAEWPAIATRLGHVDLLTGGFPCQPVSCAGKRKGETDERWLWLDMLRAIVGLRPAWILAENVPGLRTAGADTVLSGLATVGYAATTMLVGDDCTGATHIRERAWIVAHANGDVLPRVSVRCSSCGKTTRAQVESFLLADRPAGPGSQCSIPYETDGLAEGFPPAARKELLRTVGNGWAPAIPSSICRWVVWQVEDNWRRDHP